jgi:hypothetical protein
MTTPSITNELINKVDFDYFKFFLVNENENTNQEFFDKSGKQHYRLLSYLSTLYNNTTIIDIGTHRGSSALALSYNKTNTVITFDIINNVINPLIKNKENITFCYDNIFEKETREKWKNDILSCPFIFLDVDPHNGFMEIEFYNYLKDIGYNGFVICDDIWYFKEMRDNFWYKIPDNYKYDLTTYGHWSGTGVFTFNKEISFFKHDISNWTLVTAYFNLTKTPDASIEINKRDENYYMSSSISTLSLNCNLVIYCDIKSLEEIKKVRPSWLEDKTNYVIQEFDDFKFYNEDILSFKDYRNKINDNRNKIPYNFDNRNTASYYLFCMSRYIMLKNVITNNPFGSSHFGWINFCIERMGFKNLIHLNEALSVNREKFSTCYIDYIPKKLIDNTHEYFKYGRCSLCSGFFTGNSEFMYKVCYLIEQKFLQYLKLGYGHADEQLYSPVYFENPELFDVYFGDYSQMITNYVYIYDAPEAPIYNFIRNSFENGNYKLSFKACEYVHNSYSLGKTELNNDLLTKLKWYYLKSFEKIKF